MAEDQPKVSPLDRLFKLAVASYTISLFLYAPLLHVFGIEIGNVGYVISNLLAISLMFTVLSICVHGSLLARGQKSELARTMALYNITTVTYYPVIALLGTPSTFKLYDSLSQAKRQHLPLLDTIHYAFNCMTAYQDKNAAIIAWLTLLSLASFIVSSLSLVLSSEALVQIYKNDRSKTYIAAMDGILAGIVLAMLTGFPFYLFVAYAFISVS